jgi:hypothetical protein
MVFKGVIPAGGACRLRRQNSKSATILFSKSLRLLSKKDSCHSRIYRDGGGSLVLRKMLAPLRWVSVNGWPQETTSV